MTNWEGSGIEIRRAVQEAIDRKKQTRWERGVMICGSCIVLILIGFAGCYACGRL